MNSFVQIVSCLFDSDYNFHKDEKAIRLNTEPDEMFFDQYFLQLVIALDILFQRMFEHIYYLLGQDVHKILLPSAKTPISIAILSAMPINRHCG